MTKLVEIKNLKTCFQGREGVLTAVDNVDMWINKGETLGIVGESGCGKSTVSMSLMRLISRRSGQISGQIFFNGRDLLQISEKEMRKIRGKEIAMIFQEPMTSLNPFYTCGYQIAETLRLHQNFNKKQALSRAIDLLSLVGIPSPAQRVNEYPHQLSGGMRQRVMIAMALSCNPQLLIADEPTTAQDVTIQAQILELIKKLKQELGMTVMLITHDLGVIATMTERVIVMYAGKIVEVGEMAPLLRKPLHPYTEGLLKAIPKMHAKQDRLFSIEGSVPDQSHIPPGCRFHLRCPYVLEQCRSQEPQLMSIVPGRQTACWLHQAK